MHGDGGGLRRGKVSVGSPSWFWLALPSIRPSCLPRFTALRLRKCACTPLPQRSLDRPVHHAFIGRVPRFRVLRSHAAQPAGGPPTRGGTPARPDPTRAGATPPISRGSVWPQGRTRAEEHVEPPHRKSFAQGVGAVVTDEMDASPGAETRALFAVLVVFTCGIRGSAEGLRPRTMRVRGDPADGG
jgi:hypothetical protein